MPKSGRLKGSFGLDDSDQLLKADRTLTAGCSREEGGGSGCPVEIASLFPPI